MTLFSAENPASAAFVTYAPYGYEYSRWGTYHRADHLGVGVDRSSRGTGYAQQYFEPNASMYDDRETCPEDFSLLTGSFRKVIWDRKRLFIPADNKLSGSIGYSQKMAFRFA